MNEEQNTPGNSARGIASDFVIQLSRLLRVATMHQLSNHAVQKVSSEFLQMLDTCFDLVDVLSIRQVGDHLYLNDEFIPLTGRSLDSSFRLHRIFKRLEAKELTIVDRIEAEELRDFLRGFQSVIWEESTSDQLSSFSSKILVRARGDFQGEDAPDDEELVIRAFMNFATLMKDARDRFKRGERVPIPQIRRAIQLLTDATASRESTLLAMTELPNPSADIAMHATTVAAFAVMVGLRLGLRRKVHADFVLSAAFHDLAADHPDEIERTERASIGAILTDRAHEGLKTALHIGRYMRSIEAVERASAALECSAPIQDMHGVIPSAATRVISVACTYDLLRNPPPPWIGLRSDRALAELVTNSENLLDSSAVSFFKTIVGIYPVGSVVRLSSGQVGIVLETPGPPDRPTIRLLEPPSIGSPVIELTREQDSLVVEASLSPSDNAPNPLGLLFA